MEDALEELKMLLNGGRNLLKNPRADEGLDFWELTENGGDRWKVEDLPGDCGHPFVSDEATKYFVTSFRLCMKRQVINLLEEGYSAEELDLQPRVTVRDWFCGRRDCGSSYRITVRLLDEHRRVMQEHRPEPVSLWPQDCSWREVCHTFSGYGPGLRFVVFEHGGKDSKFWGGWYGVRVTASSVSIN